MKQIKHGTVDGLVKLDVYDLSLFRVVFYWLVVWQTSYSAVERRLDSVG